MKFVKNKQMNKKLKGNLKNSWRWWCTSVILPFYERQRHNTHIAVVRQFLKVHLYPLQVYMCAMAHIYRHKYIFLSFSLYTYTIIKQTNQVKL